MTKQTNWPSSAQQLRDRANRCKSLIETLHDPSVIAIADAYVRELELAAALMDDLAPETIRRS